MNKGRYYKRVILFGTIGFFCCLAASLTLLQYGSDLHSFFIIAMGFLVGSVLGAIFLYGKNHQVNPNIFWRVLFLAICTVGLSLLMFFIVSNPFVYIILLNVMAMSYVIYLLHKNTE